MTLYLDTSLLISAMTREAATREIQDWLGKQQAGELAISWWVTAEFSSALSIKLRSGAMAVAERDAALAVFSYMSSVTFVMLPLTASHFTMAARFADRHATGLRGSDALHLAVCAGYDAELCTRDKRLAAAGPVLGVKTRLL